MPLKILHLEDLQDDAEMVARSLKKSGLKCEIHFAENKTDFIKALKEFSPDIILSDHSLPSFDSHEALSIVKESGMEIPFILVTATVSEEYAVNIIKEGASDYILKDRLQRLPNAISSAINKYKLEKDRRRSEEILRRSERKYKLLFEGNPMPMMIISNATLNIIAANEATTKHYGYSLEEFLKLNIKDLLTPEDFSRYLKYKEKENSGYRRSGVWHHINKNGAIILADIIAHDVIYENQPARLILANDVTEKVKAEAELAQQRLLQQKIITETSIRVQEREREEIGKELHDNINQILVTAKLYSEMALSGKSDKTETMKKSKENIMLAIVEIRKLSHSLVAPSLGDITLINAIKDLLENIHATTTLRIELSTRNYNGKIVSNDIKLMFYRIIQEQINNIIRHSKASQAFIELGATEKNIFLIIRDNGIGFDNSKNTMGIGLRNISNRAGFYDGSVKIISAPGEGYTLEINIPIENTGLL